MKLNQIVMAMMARVMFLLDKLDPSFWHSLMYHIKIHICVCMYLNRS